MRPSPQALRYGTEAHYADAALYDRNYRRRRYDVRFYEAIAAEHGGPILELGAGSGRVTLALARAGHDVVAVDRMEPMLAALRGALEKEPRAVRDRVRVVRGDLTKVRLRGRKFALVIAPFNVFMHLYTRADVERALATCRAHLAPRGRLVFDVLMPEIRAFVRDPMRTYVSRPITDGSGRKWRYAEQFQYDHATQIQMVTAVLSAVDDPTDVRVLPLAHRQFYPQELEALLHYNGWVMEQRWGDFERGPIRQGCESQVIVARARRA
jgi:SAM-dependent methyltransferase